MEHVIIFEDIDLYKEYKGDIKEGSHIWILNQSSTDDMSTPNVHYDEVIAQSFEPNKNKFPQLFTILANLYNQIFTYEFIVRDKEAYATKVYCCDEKCMKQI